MRRLLAPAALLPLAACYTPRQIQVPSYEPRPVAIPAECDALTRRAATTGAGQLSEGEFRTLIFCQNQALLRAQEDEAVARRMEAHARTASLAIQAVTVVVGATIAVITWVF